MSSAYVRDMVRGWLTSTPGLQLPFYDTVNLEVNPGVPRWCTVAFVASTSELASYCGGIDERGTFDLLCMGEPGVGDAGLLEVAEADVALLLQQADPTGRLTLVRASAPDEFIQAGAVPWFAVAFVIDYMHTRTQGVAG